MKWYILINSYCTGNFTGYVKILDTFCGQGEKCNVNLEPRYGNHLSLDDAKSSCSSNSACKMILDKRCDGRGPYKLSNSNDLCPSKKYNSCSYMKRNGKWLIVSWTITFALKIHQFFFQKSIKEHNLFLLISGDFSSKGQNLAEIYDSMIKLENKWDVTNTIPSDEFKSGRCPENFLDLDSSGKLPYCYKIFDKQLSWNDANKECEKMSSTLLTMNTFKENHILSHALKRHGSSLNWIGLTMVNKSK